MAKTNRRKRLEKCGYSIAPGKEFEGYKMSNTTLDTRGLICPEPIMLLHRQVRGSQSQDLIHMLATDPAAQRDVEAFCKNLGHELRETRVVEEGVEDTEYHFDIVVHK